MKSNIQQLSSSENNNILFHLAEQIENFQSVKAFLTVNRITSASLFLPQTLSVIDGEFSRNPDLLYQCYEILDIVGLLSIGVYGSSSAYLTEVMENIANNRTVTDFKLTISEGNNTHFIFENTPDTISFLDSNKALVAMYLYSVLLTLTYNRD